MSCLCRPSSPKKAILSDSSDGLTCLSYGYLLCHWLFTEISRVTLLSPFVDFFGYFRYSVYEILPSILRVGECVVYRSAFSGLPSLCIPRKLKKSSCTYTLVRVWVWWLETTLLTLGPTRIIAYYHSIYPGIQTRGLTHEVKKH